MSISITPRRRRALASLCLATASACLASPVEPGEEAVAVQTASLARSTNPPGGLSPAQVPQFVSITFDDNFAAEGMDWAVDLLAPLRNPAGSGNPATFDGTPVRASFYHNCLYLSGMQSSWARAVSAGHEAGDHTTNHRDGLAFTAADWIGEIDGCRGQLTSALGLSAQQVAGFRAPFLKYNDALYGVLASRTPPFAYDTSIPSCLAAGEDGRNCAWPYTLDQGSVDARHRHDLDPAYPEVLAHPGLWEVPNPVVIVPVGQRAGIPPGQFIGGDTGKILGMDISMLFDARMTKAQALATLEHTLDLHLTGNRAPLVFVAHTHVYASSWDGNAPQISLAERRAVLAEFIAYALSKPEVRIRPVADVLAWMKSPAPLGTCTPSCAGKACGSDGCGGSCGSCSGGATCEAGQCQACVPSCAGKSCGPDGCGGVCGTCPSGQTCGAGGQCGSGPCGSPPWTSGTSYAAGAVATATCQVAQVGTACYGEAGRAFAFRCDNPAWCGLRPGGSEAGWWSAWTALQACGGACTPSCAGKACGSDGCGGTCGTCGAGQTCGAAGQCVGGTGDCAAPAFTSGTSYAAGAVVTAACSAAIVGTSCWPQPGTTFAFRCDVPAWCALRPGSGQAGWWSAWTTLRSCP